MLPSLPPLLPLLVLSFLIGIALCGAGGSRAPDGAHMLCARARPLQPCVGRHQRLVFRMPHASGVVLSDRFPRICTVL